MNIPIPLRWGLAAAVLSGLLVALGFPGGRFPTLSAGFVLPFAFVPLFVAMAALPTASAAQPTRTYRSQKESRVTPLRRGRQAFLLCWLCGVTTASFAFFWCTQPAIHFGGIPPPLAYTGFAFYALASGLFFPAFLFPFIWNAGRLARKGTRPFPLIAMVLVATALERWLPRFFFWTLGSLMHSVEAVNQWSSLLGFSGASAFILLSGGLLAGAFAGQNPPGMGRVARAALLAGLLWAVVLGGGHLMARRMEARIAAMPTVRVGFIQPNFTFSELSSNPERPADAQEQSLDLLLRMSEDLAARSTDRRLDLIVWPESVAPMDFAWSPSQLAAARELVGKIKVPILVQAVEFDEDEVAKVGYRRATMFSTSFLLRPDGSQSPVFRKWVPIPFGETIPFESLFPWWGELVRRNVGNISKVGIGTSFDALPFTPDVSVAPLICFDAIEPELPRLQTLRGDAGIFVNQANFVWMGESNAGAEFFELNRFRAIENGRSLLLAANTGPSGAVDPMGRTIFPPTSLMRQASGMVDLPVNTAFTIYTRVEVGS